MQHPAPATIDLLEPSDLVAVAQCIAIDAVAFPYASANFGLRSRLSRVLVAREPPRGRVVGFLAASAHHGDLYVKGLAVEPDGRRRGIGRSLVRAALAEARRMGAGAVVLNVSVENHAAVALYESEGFAIRHRLRGFYARAAAKGKGGDAFEMARSAD